MIVPFKELTATLRDSTTLFRSMIIVAVGGCEPVHDSPIYEFPISSSSATFSHLTVDDIE